MVTSLWFGRMFASEAFAVLVRVWEDMPSPKSFRLIRELYSLLVDLGRSLWEPGTDFFLGWGLSSMGSRLSLIFRLWRKVWVAFRDSLDFLENLDPGDFLQSLERSVSFEPFLDSMASFDFGFSPLEIITRSTGEFCFRSGVRTRDSYLLYFPSPVQS
jgi:hypothetical protein